eukprot:TRINITY_DN3945_c3_g1_i2.p1 TRINITY_DN3945_c3_g1~~TRINITY_DN3945_c3_g1_i2.p1  ORF type:complete len:382 (+),score=54.65 TRINITY_DN3945_c3_g1_i2:78-1148(+)
MRRTSCLRRLLSQNDKIVTSADVLKRIPETMKGKNPIEKNDIRLKRMGNEVLGWFTSLEDIHPAATIELMTWFGERKLVAQAQMLRQWVEKSDLVLTKDQILQLDINQLNACSKFPQLSKSIWSTMKWLHDLRTIPQSDLLTCVNILLRIPHLRGEGLTVIKQLKYRDIPLSTGVYSELISTSDTLEECLKHFEEAKQNKALDPALYSHFIEATLKFDNCFDIAHASFKECMKHFPLELNKHWTLISRSACKERKFTEALELFQYAPSEGLGLVTAPIISLSISETRRQVKSRESRAKKTRKTMLYFSEALYKEMEKRKQNFNPSRRAFQDWNSTMQLVSEGNRQKGAKTSKQTDN